MQHDLEGNLKNLYGTWHKRKIVQKINEIELLQQYHEYNFSLIFWSNGHTSWENGCNSEKISLFMCEIWKSKYDKYAG